jgi:hypothetical protein
MTDFLPKDYQAPEVQSNYMTLEEGVNSFRVLSPAIVGKRSRGKPVENQRLNFLAFAHRLY